MGATVTTTKREKRDDNNAMKKLTNVLSTKLSIEDSNGFQKCTNDAYEARTIDEPRPSKFLRYIVTYPFTELSL
jgi:hypothetical protein